MAKIRVQGPGSEAAERVLTPEALEFVAGLQDQVGAGREGLLRQRSTQLAGGARPDFDGRTRSIRDTLWEVAPTPPDLEDRRVEITGPVERKMMINALNSGASAFMSGPRVGSTV